MNTEVSKTVIAFYGSHDSSVTLVDKSNRLRVIELERLVKKRYAAFTKDLENRSFGINDEERQKFINYITNKVQNTKEIKTILFKHLNEEDKEMLKKEFINASFVEMQHHYGHAYCGHYQSGLEKTIIFSVDGGGGDEEGQVFTKCFLGDGTKITQIAVNPINFGGGYLWAARFINEIKKKHDDILSWAGKLMGLCAYGNVREEWIEPYTKCYLTDFSDHSFYQILTRLSDNGQIYENCFSGQISYDLAATNQYVFEKILFDWMKPIIEKYPDRDIVLVGGCALNVLYNQKLSEYMHGRSKKVYVPPNPNDCGLSLGFFFEYLKENYSSNSNIVYSGIELLDIDELQKVVEKRNAKKCTYGEIVDLLKQGKIIGLVYGDSEVGPRALGNRSIICDPSYKDMKDILNSKVKFREWFRPFAPVCIHQDSYLYFHDVFESNYMSYAPKVREEYRDKLRSITHMDNTSRLQTVSKEENKVHRVFLNILNKLKENNHIPVILNTSFNIKGYPILTSIKDALFVLDNTELDCVVIEDYIFYKNKE